MTDLRKYRQVDPGPFSFRSSSRGTPAAEIVIYRLTDDEGAEDADRGACEIVRRDFLGAEGKPDAPKVTIYLPDNGRDPPAAGHPSGNQGS